MEEPSGNKGKKAFKKIFVEETDHIVPQFLRYIWVGATTTLIDWGILNLLFAGFGVDKRLAAATGYMLGVVANYFLCIKWIFKSDPKKRMYEFVGSMVIGVIGLGFNDLIINYGSEWLPKFGMLTSLLDGLHIPATELLYVNIAKFISIILVLAWNFLARKYIIFRKTPKTNKGIDNNALRG